MSNKHRLNISRRGGFSFIELIIFVSLIPVIFITLAFLVTNSLFTTRINEHKILATHYAEELREWLRGAKEQNWVDFSINHNVGGYCFDTSPIPITFTSNKLDWGNQCMSAHCEAGECNLLGQPPNNIFTRIVYFSIP
ncbi:MAG: hypothetical protein ACD_24C00151G0001, partial [uncultured bacterium]